MFTLEEIDELHARLGTSSQLAGYLRALAEIGVVRFESFLVDGHSEYVAADGQRVVSPAHHEKLTVAETSDRDAFLVHLRRHAAGETTYVDRAGETLLVEGVPA